MRFGVELPTATAGMMHPVPFATVTDVVELAQEAEQLGFHEVCGNDHLSTMRFIREAWPEPPDFFEPLVTLAYVAARTSVVRLTTGILVLPMREPVLLAKQLATLDRLSGGRLTVAVAVGGYRDEFESVRASLVEASRARLTRETIEALNLLLERRRATYDGEYLHFADVESYPKPVQTPLPIYSGGNADGAIRRAAELCQGWLPAKLGPERVRAGREKLDGYARAAGRDPAAIDTALHSGFCLGGTTEEARETFLNSSFDLFRRSLSGTMTKGVDVEAYLDMNLVGSVDDVQEKVAAYGLSGVTALTALLFVANTVDEMRDQMRRFARHVLPLFPERDRRRTAVS